MTRRERTAASRLLIHCLSASRDPLSPEFGIVETINGDDGQCVKLERFTVVVRQRLSRRRNSFARGKLKFESHAMVDDPMGFQKPEDRVLSLDNASRPCRFPRSIDPNWEGV